jgi:hypothetical protein
VASIQQDFAAAPRHCGAALSVVGNAYWGELCGEVAVLGRGVRAGMGQALTALARARARVFSNSRAGVAFLFLCL